MVMFEDCRPRNGLASGHSHATTIFIHDYHDHNVFGEGRQMERRRRRRRRQGCYSARYAS
jgi:hypothetical protein